LQKNYFAQQIGEVLLRRKIYFLTILIFNTMKCNKKVSSIIFGLLVLLAGILLLGFNAGILPMNLYPVVFSWQMLVISIGFVCLFSRHSWFLGVLIILFGGFHLQKLLVFENLVVPLNGWATVLIVVGMVVICNAIWGRHHHHHKAWEKCHHEFHEWHSQVNKGDKYEAGYIERNCVFGGSREKLDAKNFKGGEINSVFGGIELDLSDAKLAEGTHHLEINSVFGGTVIYVPIDWKIEFQQTKVFGHFEDKRPKPDFEIDEKSVLIIEANSVFGGGEIRCK
jgi:predicted membrane protein